jgi:hypothetical protein
MAITSHKPLGIANGAGDDDSTALIRQVKPAGNRMVSNRVRQRTDNTPALYYI